MARLESFLESKDLKPTEVAHAAGVSRQHLLRLRKGTMSPTVRMVVKLTQACSRLLGQSVAASELFDDLA
jgi:transcriptional regulator with XRE-family HTH domain